MRLFTAILFEEDVKACLCDTINELQRVARGSFTARDNLHLTMNFIGETDRVNEVKQAMERALTRTGAESFRLSICGFGKFKRNEGDIFWIGVERENTLWRLQSELVRQLKESGFYNLDDREYKPHLTLGRRVITSQSFQKEKFEASIRPMQTEVKKISLMKSERIQGKLVYTELFSAKLAGKPEGD